MQTAPIDLRLPRRPAEPKGPLRPATGTGHEARDEAFAAAAEERRDTSATARIAEALRTQLRDLEAQQKAIGRLLEGLEG